jgi:hypothetical protein
MEKEVYIALVYCEDETKSPPNYQILKGDKDQNRITSVEGLAFLKKQLDRHGVKIEEITFLTREEILKIIPYATEATRPFTEEEIEELKNS